MLEDDAWQPPISQKALMSEAQKKKRAAQPTCNGCGKFCHWTDYGMWACDDCGREYDGPAPKKAGGPGPAQEA